jgi:hypothetical protein
MPIPLGILAVAGAGGGAAVSNYVRLQTTLITTNTASVTFDNLGTLAAGYRHLQIRYTARSDGSNTISIRTNNRTGGNYATHHLRGTGSAVQSSASTFAGQIDMGFAMTTNLSGTDRFGAGVIDFLDFSSSSKNCTIRSMYGIVDSSVGNFITLRSGLSPFAEALTRIDLLSNGNFVAGTRFSIYGIN